jgi:hypothetical protein
MLQHIINEDLYIMGREYYEVHFCQVTAPAFHLCQVLLPFPLARFTKQITEIKKL